LTYEGAAKRYSEITDEIRERLDFELETIKKTGYPGYFLIVADFISKARELGVSVGPGRGSAAGSAVAYCIGITNIDPIEYDLLFERFLNPDRVSLPDIDIDFDDEGRQKVIDYVIDKYGENQVAQIMTYGTMAAKSAIRDTARVLDIPLNEADRLAKLVPDMSKLSKIFSWTPKEMSGKLKTPEDLENAKQLISIAEGNDEFARTINQARVIEGSVRNTGIHACGVIITPDDITNYVPIARAKDTGMFCTQFDNAVVESAGMLKMDFLGLKTLTLIKHTVQLVKERQGIELDMDNISLEDEETYKLFQRGDTVGIFQYESIGMRKHLRELKPTEFADLIAMNALYRPGPMEYIPSFIKRKHGVEEIKYDLDDMEEYLKETYGITVYQEQVMLLSQKLAGFTKGEADVLRKAMGKKIFSLLEELKPKFLDQGEERGHSRDVLEKIWKDWEAFASYAFNKSHSTCYAWVAYQTAYLKANYPAEYMSAVLTNNMSDIKKVTFFMEECKRMQLPVLGPDVNESAFKFMPNKEGQIRFALSGIKGVGSGPVEAIVNERKMNGPFKSVFDLTTRVDLRQINKRCLESLAYAGALDSFEGFHRARYFSKIQDEDITVIEKAVKYGQMYKNNKVTMQNSLFGDTVMEDIQEPKVPESNPWDLMEKLRFEQEYIGIYLSGHPLDNFKTEMDYLVNTRIADLKSAGLQEFYKRKIKIGGIVTNAAHLVSKKGKPYGTFSIEDYSGTMEFRLFSKDYMNFKEFMVKDWYLFIEGTVQERGWGDNKEELVFNIQQIDLLSNVREKKNFNLTVSIPLDKIKPIFIDELETLVNEYTGKDELTIQLVDIEEQIGVNLGSKKYRVEVCSELIESFQEHEFLNVKVH
ncbi:MAG: DNA polymerase III subunit alpha, partial [Chitinophagales bacterium]